MVQRSSLDYAKPYDIMVGLWAGMACVYDAKGEYVASTPSRVAMYWHDADTLHYRQDEEDSMESVMDKRLQSSVAGVIHLSFDLKIEGKYCTGQSTLMDIDGRESMPGIYLFHLKARNGTGQYYNNQYFMNPNERHIIGPFVDGEGELKLVVAQTFTRISYDVPKKYRRELEG